LHFLCFRESKDKIVELQSRISRVNLSDAMNIKPATMHVLILTSIMPFSSKFP
jgi:hypothetical protein